MKPSWGRGPTGTSGQALSAGARLGRYELLASLGEGGMGQVWLAEQSGDVGFRKLVALKVILPAQASNGSARKMFLDEATIASRIRHANVVEVLDLGEQGQRLYQAMTFIEGASLGALLRTRGAPPTGVAVRVLIDALRGLHAAHELRDDDGVRLNLVHRDVSPQNILIGLDGVAKIADFGIAKALGRLTENTQAGRWKGKLRYVAPEQRGGSATRQADIFSAGVVLWEALTGTALFSAAERFDKVNRARDCRDVMPQLPAALAAVASRALELSPQARFATAQEMADALEAAARDARCEMAHTDVAAAVEATMADSLAALRDVVRARRRGEPLPAPPVPAGDLASAASTMAMPAQSPASTGPSAVTAPAAKAAWPRIAVMAIVGVVAAMSGGVVLGSLPTEAQTASLAPAAPTAPAPATPATAQAARAPLPRDEAVADIPHVDSPVLLPRARDARDKALPTAAAARKKDRPTTTRPVSARAAPPGDRPTFDNPY